jgi:feruloyl esterase
MRSLLSIFSRNKSKNNMKTSHPNFAMLPIWLAVLIVLPSAIKAAEAIPAPGTKLPSNNSDCVITAVDVTAERVGTSIPVSAIGEPVGGVTLSPGRWFEATASSVAYALIDGAIAPKDPKGKPINFRVLLPAKWSRRAIQVGGGGFNGFVPMLRGEQPGSLTASFARYGSDSGHQMSVGFGRPGAMSGGRNSGDDWALNEEAMRNLGYMQMKKTHDVAMVIMERVYGERPRFNYYIGGSQGGREALTVAQRYPSDYDGIVADVPIVNFSTLMLAPELIRIKEKPLSNWVTRAKINAIRNEFIRQADKLDGLADGVINNYMAARALFDMSQGDPKRNPWAALRALDGQDPNPADTTVNARLTDGQIETLKFVYSRYSFASPLANGVRSFGMWVPNTDPGGSGLIVDRRFRGQEGSNDNAPMHSHMGGLGVTGFLMQNLSANPLDYVEGGPLNKRREQISEWLDSTNPDLTAFYRRGGKIIVTIGTDDTLASPGAQLDYFQSVLDKMGREQVDAFARFYVIPQAGHGLSGRSCGTNGDGKSVPSFQIPSRFDRTALITGWVERNEAPGKTIIVSAGARSMPVCSYPEYPRYRGGAPESAESYESTAR